MAIVKARGFTVIELMIFLGMTGVLFVGLIAGVNTSLTQQHYQESVLNYSTLLQSQFSAVLNTRNDRNDQWKCETDGQTNANQATGDARGQSQCVILGRVITIGQNGTHIKTSSVVGREPSVSDPSLSDIPTLKAYSPKISTFDEVNTELDWGASLKTTTGENSSARILILRSPITGLVRTFISPTSDNDQLANLIEETLAKTALLNCVKGDTGLLPVQLVTVDPKISGANAVSAKDTDNGGVCG